MATLAGGPELLKPTPRLANEHPAATSPSPSTLGRQSTADPAVLHCLQFDNTVRESAAAASADKRAAGSNQVQRTWSFSRTQPSQLKQLIAREEQTRATAFQTALFEQAFYTYAVLVQAIIGNLSRISRTHRRRWPLLTEYLRCLEYHRTLCLALLPPVEELGQPAHLQDFERQRALSASSLSSESSGAPDADAAEAPPPQNSPPNRPAVNLSGRRLSEPRISTASPSGRRLSEPGTIGHWLAATDGKEPVFSPSDDGWTRSPPSTVEKPPPNLSHSTSSPALTRRSCGSSPAVEQASADELVLQQAAAEARSRGDSFTRQHSDRSASSVAEPRDGAVEVPRDGAVEVPRGEAGASARDGTDAEGGAVSGMQQLSCNDDSSALDPSTTDSSWAVLQAGDVTPAVLELPRVPQLPPVFSLENDPPGATSHFVQTTPFDVFKVRGANYLEDKVKMDASAAALDLLGADLVRTEAIAIEHACAGNAAVRLAQIRKDHPGRDILLINFQLPGRPGGISLMLWFGLTEAAKSDPSFYPLWQKWFSGDSDEFRNQRLKFIPHAHQASWMLKKAVGNRPVILGKAMKMRYHRGDCYLEIDIDIASSSAAVNLWGLVQSVAKGLVMDLGFVIEAQEKENLPELLLAAARVHKVDLGPLLPGLVEHGMGEASAA